MTGQDICDFIHEHQLEDAIIYNPDNDEAYNTIRFLSPRDMSEHLDAVTRLNMSTGEVILLMVHK